MDAADYYWDFTDANLLNNATGPGAYKIRFTTPGYHYIILKSHLNGCYSWPNRDTILIHDNPFAKIEPFNTNVCLGDSISLKIQGIAYPNYAYIWSPAYFFAENGLPETIALIRETGYIKLSVEDQYGCIGSDSVMINADVCCNVALPTAFTPNGDSKNDIFRIISNGTQQISVFRVVNRWGQTLWETANPKDGWDGTCNSVEQDMGTYYYYLRYKCKPDDPETHEMKGEVVLIR
jgi:gliding motility-associated-like protein